MHYISTRGKAPHLSFSEVLLTGLAPDGGLYVPKQVPHLTQEDLLQLRTLNYDACAASILHLFAGEDIPYETLKSLCKKAYKRFRRPAVVPLMQLDNDLFVQELFHGPTFSFKDVAMQLLGLLFEYVITQRKTHVTIVGATSGDTGSAAIEAFKGREGISVIILHPKGRTSDIQRKQMTSVTDPNVTNIAVEGTFDDCQDIVKALFADKAFNQEVHLGAVNSINWARIAAQITYYASTSLLLSGEQQKVSFAVPTGNFGNVLAAYTAKKMGFPIGQLTIGSNKNNILTRFFERNDMRVEDVSPSYSPSMDIQISSNFERLLFDGLNQDAEKTRHIMTDFRRTGKMEVPDTVWKELRKVFNALSLTDEQTLDAINDIYMKAGYIADPHSAIGIAAAQRYIHKGHAMIAEATAHPAKFPQTIEKALGFMPALPDTLKTILEKKEHYTTCSTDIDEIKQIIRQTIKRASLHQ